VLSYYALYVVFCYAVYAYIAYVYAVTHR